MGVGYWHRIMEIPERVILRAQTHVAPEGDCIVSLYSLNTGGRPQIGWHEGGERFGTLVHRVIWEAANGPVPFGLSIDHICRNVRCVDLTHLRLLPIGENAADNGNARKTHCKWGHLFDAVNTRRDRHGHRRCRACQKAANDARYT